MSFTHFRFWLKPGLLVLASPVLAFLPFLLVAFLALLLQPAVSLDAWFNARPLLNSLGFAVFTTLLSIEAMFKGFYWTLPVLFVGAKAVVTIDFGFRSEMIRLGVSSASVGVLYVTLFNLGTYLGWIDELFWT